MPKNIRTIVLVVVAILGIAWVASMQFEQKKAGNRDGLPVVGQVAPDFTLTDQFGKQVTLSSFKGKTVYLKFWASWCGDCLKQVVPQRKLQENLAGNESVVFLSVSVDKDEHAWRRALERNKLSEIELRSYNGEEQELNKNYNLDEIPRYILISKQGKIVENNAPRPSEIDSDYFTKD